MKASLLWDTSQIGYKSNSRVSGNDNDGHFRFARRGRRESTKLQTWLAALLQTSPAEPRTSFRVEGGRAE